MLPLRLGCLALLIGWSGIAPLWGLDVVVDYTYDTQDFFDTPAKHSAMEAAADRFSRIISSPLTAVSPGDWRIGFDHPGLGESWELSTARSAAADPIGAPADGYGFPGLAEDEWRLFVGGRAIASAGRGGTATGTNYTDVFNDPDGPLHRGVIPNTPRNTVGDLPAWGGAVTFSTELNWHFDLATLPQSGEVDFYTIALHEIGHVLGLNTSWNQWTQHVDGSYFAGPEAVAAFNQDQESDLERLALESTVNLHWLDGQYDSFVFPLGEPATVGVSLDQPQDLLLEPRADFSSNRRRFEITNVDVAALVDIGWSVIEPTHDPLDLNQDGNIDGLDVDLACGAQADLEPYFAVLQTPWGDMDFSGQVDFGDFLVLSNQFSQAGSYSQGDLDCDGYVRFGDFLVLSSNFGVSQVATVPEPQGFVLCSLGAIAALVRRRGRPQTSRRAAHC